MSIPALHHSGAKGEALPQNSHPVPPERLQALGWQLRMLAGNDIKTQASKIAQQFGQTKITDTVHLSASETIQNARSVEEKAREVANLQTSKEYYTSAADLTVLCVGGMAYYDIEDPIENMWIRVQLSEGVLMYAPGGSHTRISLGSEGYLACLLWFNKELSPSDINWVVGKETENHPSRLRYLKSIGK